MRVALILAATAVLAAACSSGTSAPPPPAPTATPNPYPAREISVDQLQSMALTLDEFGARYAIFFTSIDSPITATLERAYLACDVEKEQTALNKYGWVRGYVRQFDQPEGSGHETLTVGSDLDLFSDAQGASEKMAYDKRALAENARRSANCGGFTIERIEEFAVDGVGDEAIGLRIHFSFYGIRGTSTGVQFRRDRLVASVGISRLNSEDSSVEAIELAKKIDARVLPALTSPLS